MGELNPHNYLTAIDPPRRHPPRKWRCHYCQATGTLDRLAALACSHVYPPCTHCGQTPTCARDCAGISAALTMPGVVVAGEGVDGIAGVRQ